MIAPGAYPSRDTASIEFEASRDAIYQGVRKLAADRHARRMLEMERKRKRRRLLVCAIGAIVAGVMGFYYGFSHPTAAALLSLG